MKQQASFQESVKMLRKFVSSYFFASYIRQMVDPYKEINFEKPQHQFSKFIVYGKNSIEIFMKS